MSGYEGRLVSAALRCYPARWRNRHGDEAAELAVLLIRDGASQVSVARSYLAGAACAWLVLRPRRSPSTVAAALLAATCLLGFCAALAAGTASAKAGTTTQSPSAPAIAHRCAVPPNATHWLPSTQGTPHARPC